MRIRTSLTALLLASVVTARPLDVEDCGQKPRLVILTDIGDCDVEPDDMESAVHLLCYADRYEIEAIMSTVGWNCDPYPAEWAQYLDAVVDAYAEDVNNLRKRSAH